MEGGGRRLGQPLQHRRLIEHGAGELAVYPQGEQSVFPHPGHLGGVVEVGGDQRGDLAPQTRHERGPEGPVLSPVLRLGRGRRVGDPGGRFDTCLLYTSRCV